MRGAFDASGPSAPQFVVVCACFVAAIAILVLGQGATFLTDEWDILETRSLGDPITWLLPHNEHWIAVPVVMYRAIVETVGVGSYLPFLGLLVTFHAISALGVYRLFTPSASWWGVGAAIVLLFLGSGADDLFWAFQIGFVFSAAAGVWALVLVRSGAQRDAILSAVLLTASVASSGVGLCFLAAAAVEATLTTDLRRSVIVAVPASLAYVLWFTSFRAQVGIEPSTVAGFQNASSVPGYILMGIAHTVGSATGLGDILGFVTCLLGIALLVTLARHRKPIPPMFIAGTVGLLTLYLLIAILRVGIASPEQSRYVYPGTVLLFVALSGLAESVRSHVTGRRRLPILAITVLAFLTNASQLVVESSQFREFGARTRACEPGAPVIDGGASVESALLECYLAGPSGPPA